MQRAKICMVSNVSKPYVFLSTSRQHVRMTMSFASLNTKMRIFSQDFSPRQIKYSAIFNKLIEKKNKTQQYLIVNA